MDFYHIFYTCFLLAIRETFSVTLDQPYRNVTALTTHLSVQLNCSFRVDVKSGPTTITWMNPLKEGMDSLIAQRSFPDTVMIGKQYERRVELDEYATLELQSPKAPDSGLYRCKVTIGGDTPSSATGHITLFVEKGPEYSAGSSASEASSISTLPSTRITTPMKPSSSYAGSTQDWKDLVLGIVPCVVVLLAIIAFLSYIYRKKIREVYNRRFKNSPRRNNVEPGSSTPLTFVESQRLQQT